MNMNRAALTLVCAAAAVVTTLPASAADKGCYGCSKMCEKPESKACKACLELCKTTTERELAGMTPDQMLIQISKYKKIQELRESRIKDVEAELARIEKDRKAFVTLCSACRTPEGRRRYSDCNAALDECEKGLGKFDADRRKRQRELDKLVDQTSDKPVLQKMEGTISICALGDKASCRPTAIGTTLSCGQYLDIDAEARGVLGFKTTEDKLWLRGPARFTTDCTEKRGREVPSFNAVTSVRS